MHLAEYSYVATNAKGKKSKGVANSQNPEQLRQYLLSQNLYLLSYSDKATVKTKKLKADELSSFCREMGSMLSSGISLVRTMNIIIGRDLPPNLKIAFVELNTQIKRGVSLSDAMVMQGKTFPDLLINMMRSGEASGQIDKICVKMADHYEKEHRLNADIKGAMTYPIMLLCLTVVIVIGIFTLIFPSFLEIFKGMELPALTQIMIAISDAFINYWYMIILISCILVLSVVALTQNQAVMYQWDKLKIKMPKIGKLTKIIYTARFARTLASLYSSGLSIVNSLQISKSTMGNRYIERQFEDVIKSVKSGQPLSNSLMNVEGFDKKLSQTIVVGEESGRLDALLESMADSYDYESQVAIKKMVKLIEPLMICFMAVIIVVVMLSVMLPIYSMYSSIEGM